MYKSMVVLLASVILGYGGVAMGKGGGQHDGHGNPGGIASGHMSQEGRDNTNAQWSGGATKGQQRSDARNDSNQGHGQNHGKGMENGMSHGHEKHKGKGGSSGGSD